MEASHLQILFGPNATTHDGGHFVLVMCSLSLGRRECYRRLDAVGPGEPAVVNVANARTTAYGAPMPENRHPISSVIVADNMSTHLDRRYPRDQRPRWCERQGEEPRICHRQAAAISITLFCACAAMIARIAIVSLEKRIDNSIRQQLMLHSSLFHDCPISSDENAQ